VPFDSKLGVIANEGGRVVRADGSPMIGLYATGWIKRGPVGLIGHTKSDAMETIANLVADVEKLDDPKNQHSLIAELDARGIKYTDWAGWLKLNSHELELGVNDASPVERERVKVVDRDEQVRISRG
jgi:ferredoxin--NADP+ reductase